MINYDDKCVSTIKVIMFNLIASVPLKQVLDQGLACIFHSQQHFNYQVFKTIHFNTVVFE